MIYRDCLGILKNLSQIESNISKWEKILMEIYPNVPREIILEKVIEHYKSRTAPESNMVGSPWR